MQLKGSLQLALDEALLAPAMPWVVQKRDQPLIARRSRLQIADRGFHGQAESGADVKGFGDTEGTPHFSGSAVQVSWPATDLRKKRRARPYHAEVGQEKLWARTVGK